MNYIDVITCYPTSMRADEIAKLITQGESLDVAFARRVSAAYINERRVIEIMACLANSRGGTLLIGVDSDGTVSGCHPFHGNTTDPATLAAAVFRNTAPGLAIDARVVEIDGKDVVAVTTQAHSSPVATRWGTYRTRSLNAQGVPECVGMDPAYLFTRYRDANGTDWALTPAPGATLADLNPEAIAEFRTLTSDSHLQSLDEEGLVRALGFYDDSLEPVALGALALFGEQIALRRFLPHHHLVIADRRATPRTYRSSAPLALMLSDLQRNSDVFGDGLPLVVNALTHRDYFVPQPVYVAIDGKGLRVTSPGGVPRGVNLQAVADGQATYAPRSLYLATALARMGIARAAGSGIADLSAARKTQRATPLSFAGSHDQGVVASLSWDTESRVAAASEQSADVDQLSENEARALQTVRDLDGRSASSSEIATKTGLSKQQAYRALRKLVDAGLIRRTGETRTTRYLV